MEYVSGHDEKQKIIIEKINTDLSVLPSIVTEYVAYLRENRKSNTTIQAYLRTLSSCFRTIYQDFYLADESFYEKITPTDIAYYFDAKSNLDVKTLQSHWSVLNSFFAFLTEKSYLSRNPMQSIRRPIYRDTNRKLKYLTRSELDRLLMTIRLNPTRFTSFRDEIIIKLAISTGLDNTDMVNLNYEDIDFDSGTICVQNKKGKRTLPLGKSNVELLKKWGQFRQQYFKGNDTPALFISSKKSRLSVDAFGEMLRNYCEQANVPIITYKDLKSTMIYLLAKEKVSMEAIMELLGVSDYLMVVQAYDAAMKEYDTSILSAINNLFDDTVVNDKREGQIQPIHRSFALELKIPEYATYTKGGEGFTLYGNITNQTENPIKLKLKTCAIYFNGMLRVSDYFYSGYHFDEEFIFPRTTCTFGKIWITDGLPVKRIYDGDYVMLCIVDTDTNIEHHVKYVYKESQLGDYWKEENWYEVDW